MKSKDLTIGMQLGIGLGINFLKADLQADHAGAGRGKKKAGDGSAQRDRRHGGRPFLLPARRGGRDQAWQHEPRRQESGGHEDEDPGHAQEMFDVFHVEPTSSIIS